MPTGKPLPYMMDNEVVEVLYTCVKCAQNNIDFDEAAKMLGLKNASTAKNRLTRVMKAQQKGGGGGVPSPWATPGKARKTVGGKRDRNAKDAAGSLKVNGAGHEQANTKKPKLDIREMEEAAVQTDGSNDVTVAGESDEGPKEEA